MMHDKDICRISMEAVKTGIVDTESLLYGAGRSVIKGAGFEYIDFKPYNYGDDIRYVDWRLSARMIKGEEQQLIVKEFMSERRVEVLIALDLSKTMMYWEKPFIAIYIASVLLSVSRKLDDTTYLVILNGKNYILSPYTKPSDNLRFLTKTICGESWGSIGESIETLIKLLPNFKNLRDIILITDYAHKPLVYNKLGIVARALDSSLSIIISSSIHEQYPPLRKAYLFYKSPTGRLVYGNVSKVYDKIKIHILKCRAYIRKATPYY
ncbi:MAG TPA: DUF58 domain-containing protein, partial [Euryarchaeota archaeon]|nr:DUF58 domain-containing protein [Euryarchaeota archaeon]